MSRSLVVHHSAPLPGCTVRLTQLRMPLAKTLPGLPEPTSQTSTSARFSSLPQAVPKPCAVSQALASAALFFGMSSATLDCEPTDTYIFLPSGEKATSREKWPPPATGDSSGTTICGTAPALVSPGLYA